jgi:MAF protein
MPPIVLASSSPRRQELFALSGLDFVVRPASIPETPLPGETASAFVQRMSRVKAEAAAAAEPEAVVVAADTEVALADQIFGKPADAAQAGSMLRQLRGRTHLVLTGLSLVDGPAGARLTDLVTARVPMRDYADAEIDAYVATGNPLDKAGAYAIQYGGFQPVDLARFDDCFANVMGLPVCHALRLLRRLRPELAPLERPLGDCRRFDPAACPIVPAIDKGSAG